MRPYALTKSATTMTELWLPVPDKEYNHLYMVSSKGRIKSVDRIVTDKNGKKYLRKGRLITAKRSGNYLGVTFFDDCKSKRVYIHRMVAEAFIQNKGHKPCVNHINFDKHNNNVENLEWVTYSENTQHARKENKIINSNPCRGESHHSSKFTEDEIKSIRENWDESISIKETAKKYNCTYRAMYKILSGDSWKHINPPRAINWKGTKSN